MWAHTTPVPWAEQSQGKHCPTRDINCTLQAQGTCRIWSHAFPEPFLSTGGRKRTGSDRRITASLLEYIQPAVPTKRERFLVFCLWLHCFVIAVRMCLCNMCLSDVLCLCFIFSWVGCTVISHLFSLSILCILFRFLHLQDFGKPWALLATPSLLPFWTSSVAFLLTAWEMAVYIFVHRSECADMLQIWTVQSNYHEFGGVLFSIISSKNITFQLQTIYSQQNIVWIKHMWGSWGFCNSRWKNLFLFFLFSSLSLWVVAFGWIFALRVQVALIDITRTSMRIKSGKWIAFRGFRLMEQFHLFC